MLIKFPNGKVINLDHFKTFYVHGAAIYFKAASNSRNSYKYRCKSPEQAEKIINGILTFYKNENKIMILERNFT
ncbi:MAG: hypothetical protein K0Q53_1261 [Massilibacillus sp.]|jgi:hypothetical protein|nr:hypothetical protein [Massilibacillus sp.]